MLALIVLQAVAGPVLPAPRPSQAGGCPAVAAPADEIVVCGRRDDDRYRLKAPPERAAAEGLGRAEKDLGGGVRVSAEVESASPAGLQSNRAMIRLKLAF